LTTQIFVSWKIEITKDSTRVASVMKIICTLLQCRVHLSMFHSSSTSKIWHTSTSHDVHDNGAKAQSCVVQKICTMGGQSLLSLSGTVEKDFSFHFKHYNLTIRAVKCRKTFCTCSPSSLVQDLAVESEKKWKNFIWASWARNGRFGVFFEGNTLGPLGVKWRYNCN
jgi:hypothetical protein